MGIIKNMVLSFVCVCLFPVFISDHSLNFSNSYFSIILWWLLYMLFQYTDNQAYDRRMLKFTHGLGLVFSVMTACGYTLDQQGTVEYREISFI
ncbi:MAG: hypothetical protein K2N00_04565, partial [Lachnospiraceae bacterium]|nr:hypothetical protein [Lachnospiraceae bacterium]